MAGPDAKEIKHSSFGMISAHHVSGEAKLFMSPHHHHHFVTVEITRAVMYRDLSTDWVHGGREIIADIAMSEAQWAHFVSAPNTQGSPCTLMWTRKGDLVKEPEPPESASNRQTFSAELKEHATKVLAGVKLALGALDALLSGGAVNKSALREVRNNLSMSMSNDIDGGLGFTLKQAEGWLDTMIEQAKTEIEASHLAGLRSIALEAIEQKITSKEAGQRLLEKLADHQ